MNVLTLSAAKPTVARALNMCATDSRVVDFLNEAQLRLLNRPTRAVGCDMQYSFCVEDGDGGCITLPRQIKTVERWALCGVPGTVRSEWFDFGFNGAGQWTESYPCDTTNLKHMGTACCFNDPLRGTDDEIQVTTDVPEAVGTYLWLYGYDENNQWIRSQVGGTWYDGERVDLGSAPLITTNKYTRLTRVKKTSTNGIVRLYQYDSSGPVVVQALAFYEPSETDPIYRRILIPGLADCECSCSSTTVADSDCGLITASCYTMATARLLGRTTAATGAIEHISVGAGLTLAAGVLSAVGGAGLGDMTKVVYDTDDDGEVDEAEHANSLTLTCPDDATTHDIKVRLVGGFYTLEIA